MSDVFISYAREDETIARRLAEWLEQSGSSVWWDRVMPVGSTWDEEITRQLAAARCVIVIWSETSVSSRWVRAEAHAADERGVLLPITTRNVAPPVPFNLTQSMDLTGWDGAPDDPRLVAVMRTVTRLVGRGTGAREPPLFRTPHALHSRRAAGVMGAAVAAAALVTTMAVWYGQRQPPPAAVSSGVAPTGSKDRLQDSVTSGAAPAAAEIEPRSPTAPVGPAAGVTIEDADPPPQRTLRNSRRDPGRATRRSGAVISPSSPPPMGVTERAASPAPPVYVPNPPARAEAPGRADSSSAVGPPPVASEAAVADTRVEHAPRAAPALLPDPGIDQTLRAYERARESRDVDALKEVWPALSRDQEARLRNAYRSVHAEAVQLSGCTRSVTGDEATVLCREEIQSQLAGGQTPTQRTRTTFTLRRQGDAWSIATIRRQEER